MESTMQRFREDTLRKVKKYVRKNLICLIKVDVKGNTPLHHAVMGDNIEVVEYLIELCGADILAKNHGGVSPLQMALQKSFHDDYFMERYCFVDEEKLDHKNGGFYPNTFRNPLQFKNLPGIIERCPKYISYVHANGFSSLQNAVLGGNFEAVKYLVECGSDFIGKTSNTGHSALQLAHFNYQPKLGVFKEIESYLLERFTEWNGGVPPP